MILILGCGSVGAQAGDLLVDCGAEVVGVRRTPDRAVRTRFPIMAGDAADPSLYAAIDDEVEAVLLAANPGLRRGRDNRLVEAVRLASARWPRARLVYTGSTAVYADAAGGDADEAAAVAGDDPAVAGLLAIEQAVLAHR
nr:NAD-binding protein [Planctomycetota bacterium]